MRPMGRVYGPPSGTLRLAGRGPLPLDTHIGRCRHHDRGRVHPVALPGGDRGALASRDDRSRSPSSRRGAGRARRAPSQGREQPGDAGPAGRGRRIRRRQRSPLPALACRRRLNALRMLGVLSHPFGARPARAARRGSVNCGGVVSGSAPDTERELVLLAVETVDNHRLEAGGAPPLLCPRVRCPGRGRSRPAGTPPMSCPGLPDYYGTCCPARSPVPADRGTTTPLSVKPFY